ncbi:MAG: DNA internalization-related competence protein ComEC/Rec2, partial [Longimicrobiales bacterium]|nr:DNA internalization-related competence protein ComEC/Rec2 [Longimicrobiales bacterium]
ADGPRVVRGRWWTPPGTGGRIEPVGLFLVDSVLTAPAHDDEGAASHAAGAAGWDADSAPRTVSGLAGLRRAARGRVETLFGRRAPLAASLLLAQRDGLDREVRDRFARAGLSHLLAISGLHVALISGILLLLAGALRLGRGRAAAAAGLGTAGYVAFLGAPHSAARAAVQILLVLGARSIQRPARTEALIAAAALGLLAVEPGALFSPGFQLSFAGVAGILAIRPPLLEALAGLAGFRLRGRRVGAWLADGLATSLAATVATAPIVAWHFGRVAPIGVVANLVAIPLLSVAVPAMALAMAAGVVWVPAGRFVAGAAVVLLDALDVTAGVAAGVPGATVMVPGSIAMLLVGAAGAGWLASRRLGRTRRGVRRVVWAGIAVVTLLLAPLRPSTDRVEVHAIDVGQGDAIALRSPAGRWVLVDAGVATDRFDAGARLVVPYLSRHGARRLEGLIITHPDADHMGGAGSVIRALRPRWIMEPGLEAAKAAYLALLRDAAAHRRAWVAARRGMELELDGMTLEVLYPAGPVDSEDANDGSVVVRVVYGEFEALLTGDAPASVERLLVRRYGTGLEADVLKVGHHGSRTSTTAELLRATTPALAVISAGRRNRYGHPHRSVVDRLEAAGIPIARTDRHGSVVVRGSRDGTLTTEVERGGVAWR